MLMFTWEWVWTYENIPAVLQASFVSSTCVDRNLFSTLIHLYLIWLCTDVLFNVNNIAKWYINAYFLLGELKIEWLDWFDMWLNFIRFWLSCLGPLVYLLPKTFKLYWLFLSFDSKLTWWRLLQSFDSKLTWWRLLQSVDSKLTWWRLLQSFDSKLTWWRLLQSFDSKLT